MNIFALNADPILAAKDLCNSHCIKMILESTQMLATNAILCGATEDQLPLTKSGTPIRKTHQNHPSTIWARQSRSNYRWLINHAKAMCQEYSKAYSKTHFCEKGIDQLSSLDCLIPDGELTPFAIAISQDSKCRQLSNFESMSPVEKYRAYYSLDKRSFAKWEKGRDMPKWFDKSPELV